MPRVLTSWKEIAAYVGKGVRTVQRWERELGLPIRRPKPKDKQIVMAFPDELDRWLRGQGQSEQPRPSAQFERWYELVSRTAEQTRMAHDRTAAMLDKMAARLNARRTALEQSRQARQPAPPLLEKVPPREQRTNAKRH